MSKIRTADTILYLDFDGVLHHDSVYMHPKRGIYINELGFTLFEWMSILEQLLESYADIAIVLSTSWVRVKSFDFAKEQLTSKLQARVIGDTFNNQPLPEDVFIHQPRGVQIALDVERRRPTIWVALDDEHEGWPTWCRDNLVCTKGNMGLSEASVRKTLEMKLASTASK